MFVFARMHVQASSPPQPMHDAHLEHARNGSDVEFSEREHLSQNAKSEPSETNESFALLSVRSDTILTKVECTMHIEPLLQVAYAPTKVYFSK